MWTKRFNTTSFEVQQQQGVDGIEMEEITVSGRIVIFDGKSHVECFQCQHVFKKGDVVVHLDSMYGSMCGAHLPPQDALYDDLETISDFASQYVMCRWVQVPTLANESKMDEWTEALFTMLASFDPRFNPGALEVELNLWEIIPVLKSHLTGGGILTSFGPDSPYRVQVMPLALEIDQYLIKHLWYPLVNDQNYVPNCIMKSFASSFGRWIIRCDEDDPCYLRQEYGNEKAMRMRREEQDPSKAGTMRRTGTESIQCLVAFIDTTVVIVCNGAQQGIAETLPKGHVLVWDSDWVVKIVGVCVGYWGGIHSCKTSEKVFRVPNTYFHDARVQFALGMPPLDKKSTHFKAYGYKIPTQPPTTLYPAFTVEHSLLYSVLDKQMLLNEYAEVIKSHPCRCINRAQQERQPPYKSPLYYGEKPTHPPLSLDYGVNTVLHTDPNEPTVSSDSSDVNFDEFFDVAVPPVQSSQSHLSEQLDEKEKPMSNTSEAVCSDEEVPASSEEESSIDTSVPPELAARVRSFRKLGPLVLNGSIIGSSDKQTAALKKLATIISQDLDFYEQGDDDRVNVKRLTMALTGFNKRVDAIRNQPVLAKGEKRKRKPPSRFEDEHSENDEDVNDMLQGNQYDPEVIVDRLHQNLDTIYDAWPSLCENHHKVKKLYDTIVLLIEQAVDKPEDKALLEEINSGTVRLQHVINELPQSEIDNVSSIEVDEDVVDEMSIEDSASGMDDDNDDRLREYNDIFKRTIAETRQMIPHIEWLHEKERNMVVTKLGRILTQTDEKHVESLSKINCHIAKRRRKSSSKPTSGGYVVQFLDLKTKEWYNDVPMEGLDVAPVYLNKADAEKHAELARQKIVRKAWPEGEPPECVRVVKNFSGKVNN